MREKLRLIDVGLASATGLLLTLSFPKFDLGALAWLGLVPLLLAIEGKSLRRAFFLSHLAGVVFITGLFYWIWTVPGYNFLDYVLLEVIYLPLVYVSLWGVGLSWIRYRTGLPAVLVAPPLWVTLEYLRSHLSFLSFPWMLLGYSQYLHPTVTQIASLTGVYGLSFLLVLMNTAIAEVIISRQRAREILTVSGASDRWFSAVPALMAACLLCCGTVLYGVVVLSGNVEGETMRLALVQGNIPLEAARDRSKRMQIVGEHVRLTRIADRQNPRLIVWPESAVPGDAGKRYSLRKPVSRAAVEAGAYLLVGSSEHEKLGDAGRRGLSYNSMYLFSPEGRVLGRYRKMLLVPFGEYEPLKGYVTWPKGVVSRIGQTLPGDEYTLFDIGGTKFAAAICWEVIFSDHIRELMKRGAQFLINASNESWFEDTAGPYQLLAMSTFRAVENRVSVARAANTELTAFIDPFGRITQLLTGPGEQEMFVESVLTGEVRLSKERTFYTRHGDLFAFLQIAACMLCFLLALLNRRVPIGIPRLAPEEARRP